jgi:hypothetical protein
MEMIKENIKINIIDKPFCSPQESFSKVIQQNINGRYVQNIRFVDTKGIITINRDIGKYIVEYEPEYFAFSFIIDYDIKYRKGRVLGGITV